MSSRDCRPAEYIRFLIRTRSLSATDGSAKGGIVFAIETELGIPVKLVGLGETVSDLAPFVPREFVDALFDA